MTIDNDNAAPKPETTAPGVAAPVAGSGSWTHSTYQSGSQVVDRVGSFAGAHYRIGHLPEDTEGDGGRADLGEELAQWLNGGVEPWWMDMLRRTDAETVTTPHGCEIHAAGPMVDMADPPSWGCWAQDDSADAKITRGLMIDCLVKRDRTCIPNAPVSREARVAKEPQAP